MGNKVDVQPVPTWNQHVVTLCCYSCGLYTNTSNLDIIGCSNEEFCFCLDCGSRCRFKNFLEPLTCCKSKGHCLCVGYSGYFPTRECGGTEPLGCSVCGLRVFGPQPPAESYRCWLCCEYMECYRGDSIIGYSFDDQCLCISGQGKCALRQFQIKVRAGIQTLCLVTRCGLPSEKPNYPCGLGLCGKHCVDIAVSI